MSNIVALDVETKPTTLTDNPYALEPWRYKQGKAVMTDISVNFGMDESILIESPSPSDVKDLLKKLKNHIVFGHNMLFDVSWLYAYAGIDAIKDIDFRCTMLLAKWLHNGQDVEFSEFNYTLAYLVDYHLIEDPLTEAFIKVKSDPNAALAGGDAEYWSKRADFDTLMTRKLAISLMDKLPVEQRRGYLISQKCLPYVARSWVDGVPFNWDKINALMPEIEQGQKYLANQIGVAPSLIQSPKQLSELLFTDWGLTPINVGKTGGSTAQGDLKMLALRAAGTEVGEKMNLILKYKKLQTLQTKYMNGFERTRNYVGQNMCHGAPRIFGTYTGRYTYASKTKKKQIWQCSIAMHQLPRKGPAKSWLEAPEGYDVAEWDATGQEIAMMAIASGDVNLTSVLNGGMNVHSWMATNLTGETYDEFIARLFNKDKVIASLAYETRQAAKLTNLSCQYRIGFAALKRKFFETYDQIITDSESRRYLNIYKAAYPGVVKYWKDICTISQERGYTETIAKRRYYLTNWNSHRWATESSAINTPVQGSGGDQKDLCIWQISEKFPELKFALDMHDGLFFFIPKQNQDELKKDILSFVNSIDYSKFWQVELPVPLTFEGSIGTNFKEKEEYKV